MFAGFNLTIRKSFFDSLAKEYQDYQKIGKDHLNLQKATYEEELEKYIVHNKIIDGTRVQNDWFPEVKADIFLSHAHVDEDLVNALAGWLYKTFDLKCFIDSNIWGYAENLLNLLNKDYSNRRIDSSGGYLYDYKGCNDVSKHVNTMLNIALQKMIDKVEAVFLINTLNSIDISNDNKSISKTYSPWIYSELICSEIVRKKPLELYRFNKKLHHSFNERTMELSQLLNESITISYDAPTKHLVEIDESVLKKWSENYSNSDLFALDALYRNYFPGQVERAARILNKEWRPYYETRE